MKCTKKRLEQAIIFLADEFNLGGTYRSLLGSKFATLPELVKQMGFELFVNQFDPRSCPEEHYQNYNLVLEYAKELKKNGSVVFEKPETTAQSPFDDLEKIYSHFLPNLGQHGDAFFGGAKKTN